jgi:carboxyl-terminal processing protease
VDGQPLEAVLARLLGRPNTAVELEVLAAGEAAPRAVKLPRQPLLAPSVERGSVPQDGVGYVRLLSFQESTLQELRDAILHLQTAGMKALVLDLRGNPGGLLKAAVQVAELFLPEGTILITESPVRRFRQVHRSNNPSALALPLVVLVDGETASAAEVLAGALKENGRATLVGTTTFGKGRIQCVLPLKSVETGLKITVMKFLSPNRNPYHGRGVAPDVVAQPDPPDTPRNLAWQQARQLALMHR